MQVELPILTDEKCNKISGNFNSTLQVCAGDGTGKDTCQGDSGYYLINQKKKRSLLIFK